MFCHPEPAEGKGLILKAATLRQAQCDISFVKF